MAYGSGGSDNIFSFVKEKVTLSDFVRTLPHLSSISSTGRGKWRCNNVISGGTNPTAMVLDDDSGFFKVFSHDQQHGDVITLYQMTLGDESSSPFDSAIALAGHMGVPIDESMTQKKGNSVSSRDITQALETITKRAQKYLLFSSNHDAEEARRYIHGRGMSDSLAESWRLGLFPESNREFRRIVKDIPEKTLVESGLTSKKNHSFFPMQGRLVFPIMSSVGKTISFSSRMVDGVSTRLDSKYINTSTTSAYDKSSTLYGQHLITRETESVVICEGNFDVIALNEIAPEGVVAVATCGTALTVGHVSALSKKKSVKRIYLCFDGDDAGMDSASKSLWLHNHWDSVYHLAVPDGKDPWDSFQSGNSFSSMLKTAQPLMSLAVKHKYATLSRDDFLSWCSSTYDDFNFSDDKELFVHDITEITGLTRRDFLSSGNKSSSSHRSESNRNHGDKKELLSANLRELMPAFLMLDSEARKTICYPLMVKSAKKLALSVCGCSTERDRQALSAVISGDRSQASHDSLSEAYSLYPEDEEGVYEHAARKLAMSLLLTWRYDDSYSPVVEWVPVLHAISSSSSSASGITQLMCVFEAIATSAHHYT